MNYHTITLGRQFGSGGREIGKQLAQKLGIPFYDHQLISLAAERAEIREELFVGKEEQASNPWLFTGIYEGNPRIKKGQSAEDLLFQMQSELIVELAQQRDCIIVGRCADSVLERAKLNRLSVFICAPFSWRVHHRMELEGLSEKEAVALVEKMDKQREKYYNHYTDRTWGVPCNYDLCVNSARLGIEKTAALLAVHCKNLFETD